MQNADCVYIRWICELRNHRRSIPKNRLKISPLKNDKDGDARRRRQCVVEATVANGVGWTLSDFAREDTGTPGGAPGETRTPRGRCAR
jgi:hypothetical protein